MPALNFKAQFAPAVEAGQKLQTIRLQRKRPIKAGDTLHLFTGQRTKACRRLGITRCESAEPIEIHPGHISVSGCVLSVTEREELARADGFDNLSRFYDFFIEQYGIPFSGALIKWSAQPAHPADATRET